MISPRASQARVANSVPLRLAHKGDWQWPGARAVALYLDGTAAPGLDQRGRPLLDDDLLILANACWEPVAFSLPDVGHPADWQIELDTYHPRRTTPVAAGDPVTVGPRSLTVLRPTLTNPSTPAPRPPYFRSGTHPSIAVSTLPPDVSPQRGRIHGRRTG